MNKKKEVHILAITHDGSLALEKHEHQGYEILQLPGSRSLEELRVVAQRIVGADSARKMQNFGRAINIIIKPDEVVEVLTNIYKIEIDDISKLNMPGNFAWYSREALSSDPRGRRDARFHLRILEGKPLNLKFSEDQPGKWIEAKVIAWEESMG